VKRGRTPQKKRKGPGDYHDISEEEQTGNEIHLSSVAKGGSRGELPGEGVACQEGKLPNASRGKRKRRKGSIPRYRDLKGTLKEMGLLQGKN